MKGACPVASEVIHTLLSVDGTLITMERWGTLPELALWVRLLNDARFSAEWQRSTLLSVTTDVNETLPVVVCFGGQVFVYRLRLDELRRRTERQDFLTDIAWARF